MEEGAASKSRFARFRASATPDRAQTVDRAGKGNFAKDFRKSG